MFSLRDDGAPPTADEMFVSSNVRQYVSQATVPKLRLAPSTPPMPEPGHKSHRNLLTVRPERYRRLEQMHRLNDAEFSAKVVSCELTNAPIPVEWRLTTSSLDLNKHLPAEPLDEMDVDPQTGERPSIPCPGFAIPVLQPLPVRRIEEYVPSAPTIWMLISHLSLGTKWIEDLVLRTTQRIVQMVPEYAARTRNWGFSYPEEIRDVDSNLLRHFVWERDRSEPRSPHCWENCSLLVAFQPPWILSPRDMDQFVQTKFVRAVTRQRLLCH